MTSKLYRIKFPIIRPPVEAYSILIGVTEGCWWNNCRFCGVYKNWNVDPPQDIQPYQVRPIEEVLKELEILREYYGEFKNTIFLGGGSTMSAPTDYLVTILNKIKELWPNMTRISSYAKNLDILRKSEEDLKRLHEAGLTICYMGLESGSRNILRMMKKGTTPENMIKAAKKLMSSGIKISVYIVLGLGGVELSEEHAIETAKVLNQMNPNIFRFRTLNLIPTAPLYKDWQEGKFNVVQPWGITKELLTIFENLSDDITSYVFNDHVSNYETFECQLPDEKEEVIKYLKMRLKDPGLKLARHYNRVSM
ncbi:MAG: radical SAM protein [Candidatus Lokiarchaeota archaeon]|nr:radical SAM protein [Candidatus Lokiarchaeota archaeon]